MQIIKSLVLETHDIAQRVKTLATKPDVWSLDETGSKKSKDSCMFSTYTMYVCICAHRYIHEHLMSK